MPRRPDSVHSRLVELHGVSADVRQVPESHATVLLVEAVWALVSNGGFQRLFEVNLPGDPTLRLAAEAHERIGVPQAAAAIRMALAVFPGFRLPEEIDRRLELYTAKYSLMDVVEGRETPDSMYFDRLEEIRRTLDAYIAARASDFEGL